MADNNEPCRDSTCDSDDDGDEEHECCGCGCALYLEDGCEWPGREYDFCRSCAIDEIRNLRGKKGEVNTVGYILKIGEARIAYDEERADVDCDIVKQDYAPGFENQIRPSYESWFQTMEKLGLVDVMFNREDGGSGTFEWKGWLSSPLIECRPGAKPITINHVEFVEDSLAAYKDLYPDRSAKSDLALYRGEWLAYWLRWAIDNCKQPVFVNS